MEYMIPIVFFICFAAVLVLRPLSKNVGKLLEQLARERGQRGHTEHDAAALRMALENLGKRLDLLEDRLDFTERLLSSGRRRGDPRADGMGAAAQDERARLLR